MVASKYAKRDLMQSEFTQRANAVPAHGLGLSVDVYSPDLVHLVHSLRDEGLQPGYLEVFKATTSAMQWVRRQLPEEPLGLDRVELAAVGDRERFGRRRLLC